MENLNRFPVTQAKTSSRKTEKYTRRGFLAIGATALAVAGTASAAFATEPEKAARSSSNPRSTNPALNAQNSDALIPPVTDAGSVPAFKYPFSFSNKRIFPRRLVARSHRTRTADSN